MGVRREGRASGALAATADARAGVHAHARRGPYIAGTSVCDARIAARASFVRKIVAGRSGRDGRKDAASCWPGCGRSVGLCANASVSSQAGAGPTTTRIGVHGTLQVSRRGDGKGSACEASSFLRRVYAARAGIRAWRGGRRMPANANGRPFGRPLCELRSSVRAAISLRTQPPCRHRGCPRPVRGRGRTSSPAMAARCSRASARSARASGSGWPRASARRRPPPAARRG